MPEIGFAAVTRDDLLLLRDWLSQPHVRRWWGDPDEEIAAIAADLAEPGGYALWIARADGAPFAYLQDGDPTTAEETHYRHAPAGYRALDVLIGSPDHLGRGLAAPLLRAFAVHAAARAPAGLLLDPDPGNLLAVAAYRCAGFAEIGRVVTGPYGAALVMARPTAGPPPAYPFRPAPLKAPE